MNLDDIAKFKAKREEEEQNKQQDKKKDVILEEIVKEKEGLENFKEEIKNGLLALTEEIKNEYSEIAKQYNFVYNNLAKIDINKAEEIINEKAKLLESNSKKLNDDILKYRNSLDDELEKKLKVFTYNIGIKVYMPILAFLFCFAGITYSYFVNVRQVKNEAKEIIKQQSEIHNITRNIAFLTLDNGKLWYSKEDQKAYMGSNIYLENRKIEKENNVKILEKHLEEQKTSVKNLENRIRKQKLENAKFVELTQKEYNKLNTKQKATYNRMINEILNK